jgi:RNA polymerase sigma-70 factor (ECF subfamily)
MGNEATGMPAAAMDWDTPVRVYQPRVVASLLALSIPFDQAEELASQAWARLIEQERAGRLGQIKLPGLVIKQARFLALSWLEQKGRMSELAPDLAAAARDPEHELIARREVQVAEQVLAAASPSAQAVFRTLYDDPPPSHAEVAERVGLSVQRVRQILCEVRKKIREALEP